MRVTLTNFLGVTSTGIPSIKASMIDKHFNFHIKHTTPSFSVSADVVINAEKNVLLFSKCTDGTMLTNDTYKISNAFEDYRPHIELYCPNKQCGLNYHVLSKWMKLTTIPSVKGAYLIRPFGFMLEGVRIKNYVVHNDLQEKVTWIYSRNNEDAEPLRTSLIDFATISKDKLITRIQTIVTFS